MDSMCNLQVFFEIVVDSAGIGSDSDSRCQMQPTQGPIPTTGPPIPDQFRIQSKTALSSSPDSGFSAMVYDPLWIIEYGENE